MNIKNFSISIVGSGNVATHLAQAFAENGITIDYILSRNISHAKKLAEKIYNSQSTSNFQDLSVSDMILLCVTDSAIEKVAKSFAYKPKLLAHTSGTTPIDILDNYAEETAVFYPLQTFSKDKSLNYNEIPICVEAKNKNIEQMLLELGHVFSQNVRYMSSSDRETVHLAAVFVANFTNYLHIEATEILEKQNIDRNILFPLMKEVLHKILKNHPKKVQTGPAYRNDEPTMERHLTLLKDNKTATEIYQLLSKCIKEMKH